MPLFVGEVSPEVRAEVARIALERKAVPFFYNQEFSYHQETSEIEIVGKAKLQLELGKLFLSGKHQKRNAILASSVANYLGLSSSSINKGLQIARWPGRLEYVDNRNGQFLLHVAHNPGGIEVLNDYILEEVIKKYKDISFMISILSRKDWKGMLDLLSKLKSALATKDIKANFIFTNSDHYQSADPKMLQEYFGSGEIAESCDKGLELAAKTNSELVIVTGSLFLVGKVRPMIGVEGYCSIEG